MGLCPDVMPHRGDHRSLMNACQNPKLPYVLPKPWMHAPNRMEVKCSVACRAKKRQAARLAVAIITLAWQGCAGHKNVTIICPAANWDTSLSISPVAAVCSQTYDGFMHTFCTKLTKKCLSCIRQACQLTYVGPQYHQNVISLYVPCRPSFMKDISPSFPYFIPHPCPRPPMLQNDLPPVGSKG